MRIGIFTDRYLPQTDGVAYSIETYRIELERLGHEVYIFAPRPSWRYHEHTKRIIRFPAVKGIFFEDYLLSLFFPPQALKQIEKLKLDIVHFQTPAQIGMLGAYFAFRNHMPTITTYHTDLYEYVKHYPAVLPGTIALSLIAPVITGGSVKDFRNAMGSMKPETSIDKWNQKIVIKSLVMLHNRCDLVVVPSRKIQKQLQGWKTVAPVVTLPTGVDKITTTDEDITVMRRRYGLSTDDQVILFVGRIGTEKNLALLIRAFEVIARRNARAKLVFVGHGDDLPDFQDQAEATKYSDRIIFTGRVDRSKLGGLYGAATVFAFPSLADTQGMVVNEAACAGLPIVMIDRQISEVFKDGENGYFARNGVRDFASKINRILDDDKLRQRMSKRSIELGSEISAGKQAVKLLRLYEETIERHRETVGKTHSPTSKR